MHADEPEMPSPEPGGLIPTLNKMGYMTTTLDAYSREFVSFLHRAPGPALEIGAAYGVATTEALATGARVLANDIDYRHLKILESRVPSEHRQRLELIVGSFPDEIAIDPGSLGAVLIARVLHFFDGPTIERSAARVFNWLAPGGRVFVVGETPYLKNWAAYIPRYEQRKAAGEKWPGFNDNLSGTETERSKLLPKQMHHLDPDVLHRTFSEAGFTVLKAATFAREEFPEDIKFDGRESVGLIAEKPIV